MLYWLPQTGASSARMYWESFRGGFAPDVVTVPMGGSVFPKEIFRASRRWAARQFQDIRYWSEPPVGGHFAAFEQPAHLRRRGACLLPNGAVDPRRKGVHGYGRWWPAEHCHPRWLPISSESRHTKQREVLRYLAINCLLWRPSALRRPVAPSPARALVTPQLLIPVAGPPHATTVAAS